MKRRDFVRLGAAAAATPAVAPLLDLGGTRGRPRSPAPGERTGDPVRICYNESPMGVPGSAREAMREGFAQGNLYPVSDGALKEALAARHGVEPEGIVLGNGSTDAIRMTVQAEALAADRLRIVQARPTFGDPRHYGGPHPNVEVAGVPLVEGSWAHDLGAMRDAADSAPGAVLVYVCNPNNPTGTLTPVDDVHRWIDEAPEDHLFLVDEAYHDFVDDPSYRSLGGLAFERSNVVVARTFSKVFGMAGIRVGYAVARPSTARRLRRLAVVTTPNHLGNVAAMAALEDDEFVHRSLETNRRSKRIVRSTLDDLGLSHMESHTNFVMHEIGTDVGTYADLMLEQRIRVGRPFPPFRRRNRVSLGTPEQMERWAEALRSIQAGGWA